MQRLKNSSGRPSFNIVLYALNKRGDYGSASIFGGKEFAVHDGTQTKLHPSAYLFKP